MDEEKDLNSNNQDDVNSNDTSDNNDIPLDEQNSSGTDGDSDSGGAGNGYGQIASSNKQAFSDAIKDPNRLQNQQERLRQAKLNEANPYKMNRGHEDEDRSIDSDTGSANFREKNVIDKAKDKIDTLGAHAGVVAEGINKGKAAAYLASDPIEAGKELAKEELEQMKKAAAKKILLAIGGFISAHAGIIFLVALGALIIISMESSDGGIGSNAGSGECGFTISSTSLTKDEYKAKLEAFAQKNSKAKIFAQNAESIYNLAVSSNINPELVIVRAHVEGYSPGAVKNNYWGMGCTNEGGYAACITYDSFMSGVKGFVDNISKYSSLSEMMSKYAYIGKRWDKGSSSSGGCYYFEYIKDYYADTPEAQRAKQRAAAACAAGGTGIATNKYDQEAYATYQVNKNMAGAREKIFGLTDKNSVCSGDNIVVSEDVNEIIKLSDAEAWKAITGLNHKPRVGEISRSQMSSRMVTIEVPYRTWADSNDKVIGKVGKYNVTKKFQKITVNKAVAPVFKAFFTDVFNHAPNFVIRTWDGCYVFRANTSDSSSFSAHAFGVACDINAGSKGNGYGQRAYTSWAQVQRNVSGKGQYEAVYKGSDVMKIAHKYTITNGSDWSSSHDAMHFSFIGDKTREFSKSLQNK